MPSYLEVKAEILRRITSRKFAPGALLPGEIELAAQFDVARGTVNRAMRELTDEGFVERRRKGGTRVRLSPLREARFHIPIIRGEIESAGLRYSYLLLVREIICPPEDICKTLGTGEAVKALHLTCLHSADGNPYQHEDRWISLKTLPQARDADFSVAGPNEWLVRTVPYSNVEVSFLAAAADSKQAQALQVKTGDPLFCAERTTWWQRKAITHVKLLFGKNYRMTAQY